MLLWEVTSSAETERGSKSNPIFNSSRSSARLHFQPGHPLYIWFGLPQIGQLVLPVKEKLLLGWSSINIWKILMFQGHTLESLYGRTHSILWGSPRHRDWADTSRSFCSTANNGNTTDSNLPSKHNFDSYAVMPSLHHSLWCFWEKTVWVAPTYFLYFHASFHEKQCACAKYFFLVSVITFCVKGIIPGVQFHIKSWDLYNGVQAVHLFNTWPVLWRSLRFLAFTRGIVLQNEALWVGGKLSSGSLSSNWVLWKHLPGAR